MFTTNLLLVGGFVASIFASPSPQFGDNPLTDLGGDNPFTDLGGDNPFTDLGGDNPFTDLGGDNPFTDLGGDNPFTDLGGDDPFTDIGNPTTGVSLPTGPAGITTPPGGAAPTGGAGNPLAGMPTLPPSVAAALESAVPSSVLQSALSNPCDVAVTQDWVQALPTSIQSELVSYESSIQSWFSANSAALASVTGVSLCKNGAANTGSGSSQNTGAMGKGSTGAGPQPTAALGASLAGAVGLLGLMVAL